MRVGLGMLTFVPGAMGGAERYAVQLARALVGSGTTVTALVQPGAEDVLPGVPTVTADGYGGGAGRVAKLRRLVGGTLRPGPLRELLGPVDALHYPFTVPVPRAAAPWATTLHDLQHHDLPGAFPRAERMYRTLAYDRAARRADAVIVVSEFVRSRAVDRLGLDPGRVHVVHHGVDHDLFRPGDGEREPLLLYPARRWPHKNHERLFEAFALLRRERPELELVLTGGDAAQTRLPDGVHDRGAVTDEELALLYRKASCLVFPSLYEGFGLPLLEAMASGCPVAASTRGAIPEVCGDAAVLFDPLRPAEIAAGVSSAISRSDELRALGRERASRFTWKAAAAEHRRIYETLAC